MTMLVAVAFAALKSPPFQRLLTPVGIQPGISSVGEVRLWMRSILIIQPCAICSTHSILEMVSHLERWAWKSLGLCRHIEVQIWRWRIFGGVCASTKKGRPK